MLIWHQSTVIRALTLYAMVAASCVQSVCRGREASPAPWRASTFFPVFLHDLRGAEPGILKVAQIPEQIAHGEIDRIAQAARAILLRDLLRGAIGLRQAPT